MEIRHNLQEKQRVGPRGLGNGPFQADHKKILNFSQDLSMNKKEE
jgi:hypothetical protein